MIFEILKGPEPKTVEKLTNFEIEMCSKLALKSPLTNSTADFSSILQQNTWIPNSNLFLNLLSCLLFSFRTCKSQMTKIFELIKIKWENSNSLCKQEVAVKQKICPATAIATTTAPAPNATYGRNTSGSKISACLCFVSRRTCCVFCRWLFENKNLPFWWKSSGNTQKECTKSQRREAKWNTHLKTQGLGVKQSTEWWNGSMRIYVRVWMPSLFASNCGSWSISCKAHFVNLSRKETRVKVILHQQANELVQKNKTFLSNKSWLACTDPGPLGFNPKPSLWD